MHILSVNVPGRRPRKIVRRRINKCFKYHLYYETNNYNCHNYFSLFLSTDSALSREKVERRHKKNDITILTYNVRNCRGLDNITDYQRVADIISRIDPEITALQEPDSVLLRK